MTHHIKDHVVLEGVGVAFEDINFSPLRSGGPVANRPDDVTIDNCFYKEFTSANNQSCGDQQELFHYYKLGGTLAAHAHVFLKAGETAGTTGVVFTINWRLSTSTGTTSGSVVVSATSAELTANPHKVDLYNSTPFAGSAELGGQLALTLARTGGNAGDVVVLTYGVHLEIDSFGSNTVSVK